MDYESECGVSYDDYVRDNSELSSFDQEQIDKDMARTRPRSDISHMMGVFRCMCM